MLTITIVGTGRAGGALAIALERCEHSIDALIHHTRPADLPLPGGRRIALADVDDIYSDVLIIATPDPEINSVAASVSRLKGLPRVALHLSGSLTSGELAPLKKKGIAVGSMHPLVSISDPISGAERFAGSYFCIEGDDEAKKVASTLVTALGGTAFSIETSFKPLYHAAAVMASGNVTALFDAAVEMLSNCGLDHVSSHAILLPLLQSTVANLSESSTSEALTGPFVRGDIEAFQRHLQAIERLGRPDIREIYLALAERSARIANNERSNEIVNSISIAKRSTRC